MIIVVTGARGLLGSEIMRFLGARETAIGWSGGTHEGYRRIDIMSQKDIDHGLDIDRPDIVIHCAANPNIGSYSAWVAGGAAGAAGEQGSSGTRLIC